MIREDMLALLIAQAKLEGSELVTLRALVEESCELGANRVIARLGLSDDDAPNDLGELRELLAAWRDAKASAWKAAVQWVTRGFLALLLIGIAVRFGLPDLLK